MAINAMDFYYYFMKSSVNPLEGSVNCVIKIDGDESVPISTRIKTLKKNWNAKEQCFEGKDSAKKENLKQLWEKRMESIRNELVNLNPYEAIDPNDILKIHRANKKEIIESRKPQEKINASFLQHFRNYISFQEKLVDKKRLAPITLDGYIAKRNRIADFLRSRKMLELKTEKFDGKVMMHLKEWMIMNDYQDSTIAKYERLIKTVQAWAYKKGLSQSRPLEDYKIEMPEDKEPISLESEELALIENLRISGKLHKDLCITADIYRFCMETSLSNCDYDALKNTMLSTSSSGTMWINCHRGKSKVKHRIPVSEKAKEIIERYGSLELLPRKSNYHLNKGIRTIAKQVGITKHLTFHTSRKSAANDMLNNKMMRETTIQAVMGWKDGRQLKRYAKVSESTIENEFFN